MAAWSRIRVAMSQKKKRHGNGQLVTRRPVCWRIPFDVLEDVQEVARKRRVTVTDCVVQAIQAFTKGAR